jgi:hypothetical protein
LPLTPSTVIVTSSPIIRDSPTLRVKINMIHFLVPRIPLSGEVSDPCTPMRDTY